MVMTCLSEITFLKATKARLFTAAAIVGKLRGLAMQHFKLLCIVSSSIARANHSLV